VKGRRRGGGGGKVMEKNKIDTSRLQKLGLFKQIKGQKLVGGPVSYIMQRIEKRKWESIPGGPLT
jgi:hypothetical protein